MQQTPVIAAFGDLTLIGRGAFAHVYRGYDEAFNREVAIKVIDAASLGVDGVRRFERECRAIGAVSAHPKIVTVYSSGTLSSGSPYIVMDLMSGSLTDVLDREGPLAWRDAVAIGCDIASAVQAAHDEGILHRDIKPDNILISRYGHAQLADFGISSVTGAALGAREAVTASVAHAAPEIIDGRRATAASDVYSLASTIVTMILGRAPFTRLEDERVLTVIARIKHEQPPRLADLGVPSGLQTVLDKAMAKNPDDRYAAAIDFAAALAEFRPRTADTRNLLAARRPPEPPAEEPPAAPVTQNPTGGSLIPPGSLIPGSRLSRVNGLIPPAGPERPVAPFVPAPSDPVGGSNRRPVNPALSALIPLATDAPTDPDQPVVEVLRPDDGPAGLVPVEVEPAEINRVDAGAADPGPADVGSGEPATSDEWHADDGRGAPTPVRVLRAPERPLVDPSDPLLALADEPPVTTSRRRRRTGLWWVGGILVLGAGAGAWAASSAGHHHPHQPAAAVVPTPLLAPLPSPSFTSTCDGWTCTFTASTAALPAGSTLQWAFPDGTTATGPTARHTFQSAGSKQVSLAVSEGSRTGAPSTSDLTMVGWTPSLSISTSGPRTAPTISLRAATDQSRCLAGAAQLQRRSAGKWQEIRTVSFNGASTAEAAAPSSGTYRWLVPASSLPKGECLEAISPVERVTIAAPPTPQTSSPATTVTTQTQTTPPPTTGSSPPARDPRTNPPVPPGG